VHKPPAFNQTDKAELRALATEYPLATLVVASGDNLLINHIPLLWNIERQSKEELHGHIPRSNELVAALSDPVKTLTATAVFRGPEDYISPADYPSKARHGKVVPTWNYAVAHLSGQLELRDDDNFVRQQIDQLTAQHEARANPDHPWSLDDAPTDFAGAMLNTITGIALSIERVEGKYKLSQNRDAADRSGAANGVSRRGNKALAELMRTFTPD